MPGTTPVREFSVIGKGHMATLFEMTGLKTLDDVKAVDLDDVSEDGPLKRLFRSIDVMKNQGLPIINWGRFTRRAYNRLLFLKNAEAGDAPECFQCPISGTWFEAPMLSPVSGHSYSKVHIERWLRANPTDPMNREPLTIDDLVPNRALVAILERYRPLEEGYFVPDRLE